jgi:outer membrane protein assembly factor BamB
MDNTIKIAALIGIAFCVMASPAAAQLADTSWPMFHHDLNHTGQSTHNGPDIAAVKWTFPTGDRIYGSASIGEDGTVYIGTNSRHSQTDSKLYGIYPNGTERWHWSPPPHNTFNLIDSTPAVASDGTIYVVSKDRRLYALYPNGTEKWEFHAPLPWWLKWCCCTGFSLTSSPTIGLDGTIYIGSNNHNLYAINPNGTEKWNYKTKGAIQSSPAVG